MDPAVGYASSGWDRGMFGPEQFTFSALAIIRRGWADCPDWTNRRQSWQKPAQPLPGAVVRSMDRPVAIRLWTVTWEAWD